jgi:hypothetical protein
MKTLRSERSWLRPVLALAAAAGLLLLAGCEEEGGGIGASTTLPSIFTNTGAEPVDTGVGSIHWVGNPRW